MRFSVLTLALVLFSLVLARPPSPPVQPSSGPGGSDYYSRGTMAFQYRDGSTTYWVVEPADPKPEKTPVVIFFPDVTETDLASYKGWIDHMVRRGFILIFPVYNKKSLINQEYLLNDVWNTITAARNRLDADTNRHIVWNMSIFCGHGMGSVLAYETACRHKDEMTPKALLLVSPDSKAPGMREKQIVISYPPQEYKNIGTLILGGADTSQDQADVALTIYKQMLEISASSGLDPDNLKYMIINSDDRGTPPLSADKYFALAKPGDLGRARIDCLDYNVVWKFFDVLTNTSFAGKPFTVSDEDSFIGNWSDGISIKPLSTVRYMKPRE
jgi:pimeloyl-ACP methyl ester carboxylesterase